MAFFVGIGLGSGLFLKKRLFITENTGKIWWNAGNVVYLHQRSGTSANPLKSPFYAHTLPYPYASMLPQSVAQVATIKDTGCRCQAPVSLGETPARRTQGRGKTYARKGQDVGKEPGKRITSSFARPKDASLAKNPLFYFLFYSHFNSHFNFLFYFLFYSHFNSHFTGHLQNPVLKN